MAEQIKTFKDIQDAIIRRGKIADNTVNRNDLKEKINSAHLKLCFSKSYRWSGMTRDLVLKAKYTTGTISVTNGSHAITGSSTVWTEQLHLRWKIKIGSNPVPYSIVRVAGNTSATIEPAYTGDTASGVSYTLYKDEYGLYPDLQNIRKLYIPGAVNQGSVYPRSPDYIDDLRYKKPFLAGVPKHYTINGKNVYHAKTMANWLMGIDFFEDPIDTDNPRQKNLILYPCILSEDKIAKIRYSRIPPVMGLDAAEPLVPYENRMILVLDVIREHFLQNRDARTRSMWDSEYKDYLKEMSSDIENYDDELIFMPDRSTHRKYPYYYEDNDVDRW